MSGIVRLHSKIVGKFPLVGKIFAAALFTLSFTHSSSAHAGDKLGDSIQNVVTSSMDLPMFLSALCYLFGIVLGAFAIAKLVEHVNAPQQHTIWEVIKRVVAAGAFFALPTVMEAVINTVAQDIDTRDGGSGFNTPGAAGEGLDAMMVKFMMDVWQPMIYLLSAFGYLAGIILVMVGITRMLKSAQEGPKGPGGFGTIMTFIVAGALMSLDQMLGAFGNSMFSDGTTMTFAEMNYKTGMDEQALNHAHTVISSLLAFVMILGMISFIRGFLILREHAEGNHQASLMAGMTHLIGGTIAVNLGSFINVVQETLGLTDYGITFG